MITLTPSAAAISSAETARANADAERVLNPRTCKLPRAVESTLLDLLHAAYLGDKAVRGFLLRENPAAARALAERLEAALRLGLWHPSRNDVGLDLAAFAAEARP